MIVNNAAHVRERAGEWIKTLITMRTNLEKWVEAQDNWMYLRPIFASKEMQDKLPEATREFFRVSSGRTNPDAGGYFEGSHAPLIVNTSVVFNPKAVQNLAVSDKAEIFEKLIKTFSKIK